MKILVLGTGWMGRAAAFDIVKFGKGCELGLADQNPEQLEAVSTMVDGAGKIHTCDCNDRAAITSLFKDYDIVISAVPYRFNAKLSSIAIDTKTHFLDLGGNNDIVRDQLGMHKRAQAAGVTIIPNCGLAPGLSNILAMTGFKQFDKVDSIQARVGGLPQHPRPPLYYQLVFSVEGLINEYIEQAEIIEEGERTLVPSMTGLESLSFGNEFPELEAFYTSGGLSLLPELLEGKVRHLSYKTIRYPGHHQMFNTLLDIGFAETDPVIVGGGVHTSRELFAELLRKKLSGTDEDVVLFRVDISGFQDDSSRVVRYEMVDRYDPETTMTAMMRTTAYPTTAIALMLGTGAITQRGVYLPENIVDGEVLIETLQMRNIRIHKSYLTGQPEIEANSMKQ